MKVLRPRVADVVRVGPGPDRSMGPTIGGMVGGREICQQQLEVD